MSGTDTEIFKPRVPGISDFLEARNIPASAVVKANGWVFVSGLPPADPGTGEIRSMTIEQQTRLVLESLRSCLEAAGSSLDKVVKCQIYCSNAAYFETVNEIYAEYFAASRPARVFLCVAGWFGPFDIEMDCIAVA